MATFSSTQSRSLVLTQSTEAQVYGLFALAMGITVVGVFLGIQFAEVLFSTGILLVMLLVELALIFTSRFWVDRSPLNYILFALFPFLSGITITPYLLSVLVGYANGGAILMNALTATVFMTGASAVIARGTGWNLSGMGRGLLLAVLGLIALSILQIFVPAFRTTQFELLLSGAGIIIFALFTAFDLQRIAAQGKAGANPFLLALSLYLDIFNLFMYILRFMIAISGNRR